MNLLASRANRPHEIQHRNKAYFYLNRLLRIDRIRQDRSRKIVRDEQRLSHGEICPHISTLYRSWRVFDMTKKRCSVNAARSSCETKVGPQPSKDLQWVGPAFEASRSVAAQQPHSSVHRSITRLE